MRLSIFIILTVLMAIVLLGALYSAFAILNAANAQTPQEAVGSSAKRCKDTTMHPDQPERYLITTFTAGTVENPQHCVELLDIKQIMGGVCQIWVTCEAT